MKKLIPVLVIGVLILTVGLVAAQNGGLPGTGWLSGQQIQNVGTGTATVAFTAYDLDGDPTPCDERSVPAGGSTTWATSDPNQCPVKAGFIGSAVVSANEPIAAIVNVSNNPGRANGQYQGTDGADVNKNLSFPLVKNNHVHRTTTFYVQNAGSGDATITATFSVKGVTKTKAYPNVKPNAMVVISPSDAGVAGGNGQVGSLSVAGTEPLAGSALEHEDGVSVPINLQASKAFTPNDYAKKAYCPLYRSEFAGQKSSTGVQVQNVDASAQNVTLKFIPRDGGTPTSITKNIPGKASATWYAPNEGFAPGSIGSAEVTSGGNIVAVTNEQGESGVKQTTYACFPDTTSTAKINVPLAKELFVRNTTGIQIQNVGTAPANNIQLVYTDSKNSSNTVTVKNAQPVAVGGSFTVYLPSDSPSTIQIVSGNPASIKGKNNSVVITADQKIVAIANEIDTDSSRNQDNKNYEGFNQ